MGYAMIPTEGDTPAGDQYVTVPEDRLSVKYRQPISRVYLLGETSLYSGKRQRILLGLVALRTQFAPVQVDAKTDALVETGGPEAHLGDLVDRLAVERGYSRDAAAQRVARYQ
jgi:hypothetical protein